jgi:hypothetical protein
MKAPIALIFFLQLLLSCDKAVDNLPTQFIVRVDSIAHNSFAASNDTVSIRFYGTIGPDGCYAFSHFESTREPLQLDLTVWGQHDQASVCPAVMVYLGGKEYRFVPGSMGWFKINVHQPDSSVIRDSIIVK